MRYNPGRPVPDAAWLKRRKVLIDIPVPEKRGSFWRMGSTQGCYELLDDLFHEEIEIEDIPGLTFGEWYEDDALE
jgi:hypothetical protein